jgi:hypothetical protein
MKKRTSESAAFALKLQDALREVFPGVVVREYFCVANDGEDPVYDVFFVPDDPPTAFFDWMLKDYVDFMAAHGFAEYDLLWHETSATRKYYPEIKQDKAVASTPYKRKPKKIERAKPAQPTKR